MPRIQDDLFLCILHDYDENTKVQQFSFSFVSELKLDVPWNTETVLPISQTKREKSSFLADSFEKVKRKSEPKQQTEQ